MKFDRLKNELIKLGWGAGKENIPDYEPNNISKYGLTIDPVNKYSNFM